MMSRLQIDFMGRRKTWFIISGVVILISVISLATRGLNLGIDFRGGVQVTFKTKTPTSLAEVRDQTTAIGRRDAVVQGRGQSSGGDKYQSFQIRVKKLTQAEQNKLTNDLTTKVQAIAPGVKNVSSSFGRQIARSAILAVLFSMFVITLYITLRFHGVAFAVPVIVALIHDIVITIGVYSLTGREVTESTVAAVLTVLGYSIYDTIIIFDRIRENIPIMRRSSFATIANISLWETIRRSLATSFITLLPVGALFLFGGDTLKDFAFALMVGIAAGAYSSIFIAAPLLTILKEREPEYARRKGDTLSKGGMEAALEEAEEQAAEQPAPALVPAGMSDGPAAAAAAAKREARRQRRRTRPHGRAR